MPRYHGLLVALHWLLAVLIIGGLIMGGSVLSATPNSAPEKIFYLQMHMTMGSLILLLMVVRLFVRLVTKKPTKIDTGNKFINTAGTVTHYLFYLIVFLVAASGIAIANLAGLPEIVFGSSSASLPLDFNQYPPRKAHGALTILLSILIVGHIAAFLYHQIALKDKLFSRMWFRKNSEIN